MAWLDAHRRSPVGLLIEHADLAGPSEIRIRWYPPGRVEPLTIPVERLYTP